MQLLRSNQSFYSTIFKIWNSTSERQRDWNRKQKHFNYLMKRAKLLKPIIDFRFAIDLDKMFSEISCGCYLQWIRRHRNIFCNRTNWKAKVNISNEIIERLLSIQRSRDLWRRSMESYKEPRHREETNNKWMKPNWEAP